MGGEKSESVAVSDTEGAKPQEDEPEAVPCYSCKMPFNGRDQYRDHLKSKRHRTNMRRLGGPGRCVMLSSC